MSIQQPSVAAGVIPLAVIVGRTIERDAASATVQAKRRSKEPFVGFKTRANARPTIQTFSCLVSAEPPLSERSAVYKFVADVSTLLYQAHRYQPSTGLR